MAEAAEEDSGDLPARPADPLLSLSPGFADWLAAQDCALAFTTYQAGRLFMIGRRRDGRVRVHERLIEQCQGLWTDGESLWTSGLHTLWRFANLLPAGGRTPDGVDRRFGPREGRVTGRIDIHDIGVGAVGAGRTGPVFVATAFNCLATVSDSHSFRPLWRPPFISALVGEDRCHLNGLAMDGGRPAYVTAVAACDEADGWRRRRRDGGVVVEVASGEVVADGLSMPHSPRLHEGRLWMLDSGRGELCAIDPRDGARTPVAFCPGYARGLGFAGRYAVIGLSRPRRNRTFEGLELDDRLAASGQAARAGLLVVDLDTGRVAEWLRFERLIDELYDVAVLPGVRQPEAVGFRGELIQRAVTPEPPG